MTHGAARSPPVIRLSAAGLHLSGAAAGPGAAGRRTWSSGAASTWRSPGRPVPASRPCSTWSACWTGRPRARSQIDGIDVGAAPRAGPGRGAGPPHRLRLPVLPPAAAPDRGGERDARAGLRGHAAAAAARARRWPRWPRSAWTTGRDCAAHRAVRRRAAAGGDRPGPGQPPVAAAVRRADRQPGQRDHQRADRPARPLHAGGTTLVVITHNPAVAGRAQRRITIRDGMLTECRDGPAGSRGRPRPGTRRLDGARRPGWPRRAGRPRRDDSPATGSGPAGRRLTGSARPCPPGRLRDLGSEALAGLLQRPGPVGADHARHGAGHRRVRRHRGPVPDRRPGRSARTSTCWTPPR